MKRKGSIPGALLIAAGLLLILGSLLLTAYNFWEDREAETSSAAAVSQLQEIILQARENKVSSGELPTDPMLPESVIRDMPTIEIDGRSYIGVMEIPSLDVSLPVLDVWDYNSLKIAPCHYLGSYFTDDLVIAGHSFAHHFRPLRWIEPGADVYFINAEGTVYHYMVDNVETLRPQQVEDLTAGEWDLTLFTCNAGGRTRCIVRCVKTD